MLPALIPRAVLFSIPKRDCPQISPDGDKISYLTFNNGIQNICIKRLDNKNSKQYINIKVKGLGHYFWLKNSQYIIYLQDINGNENWNIYSINIENKVTRNLTPFNEGVRAYVIDTNPNKKNELLIGLNLSVNQYQSAYRLYVDSGIIELECKNKYKFAEWIADNSLKIKAAVRITNAGGKSIYIRKGDNWKKIIHWSSEDANISNVLRFSSNNKSLYLFDSRNSNTRRLVKYNINTGSIYNIAEDQYIDVNDVILNPITYKIQAVSFEREKSSWLILDSSIKEDLKIIERFRRGNISLINRDLLDKKWIVQIDSDTGPIYYYLYNRDTKQIKYLFASNPKLTRYQRTKIKPISFKSRDGLVIHGYLGIPCGMECSVKPLIVNVHSGPWSRDSWTYNPEMQWLLNRGYACLQINYRGSTGYGKNFVSIANRQWGHKMQEDLIDGVNWAITNGIADPKRIAIYGHSYGGYAALVGAAFTPDTFCCAVSIMGPTNLLSMLKSIPPYWKPMKTILKKRVGDEKKDKCLLKSNSPYYYVNNINIPLVIIQGQNDPRINKEETDKFVRTLLSKGKDVIYMCLPSEGHEISNYNNRINVYKVIEIFLAKHLRGRCEK